MWKAPANALIVVLGLGGAATYLTGCHPDDDLSAMSQSHTIAEGDEVPAGHTCASLSSPAGSGWGETTDGFWVRESTDRKGLRMEWGSGDEILGSKSFDRDFFASGEVERFILTEPSGTKHSFMIWGAHGCERCPQDYDFEALPGDVWGCGSEPPGDSTDSGAQTDTDAAD
jgi:hypothetical protein